MRKIIPLIVLILCCAVYGNAQSVNDLTEQNFALQIVDANKAAIGITADQYNNAIVSSTFEDNISGIRYVYLQQSFQGIPVDRQLLVLAFRNGKLISKAGEFNPGIEKLANVKNGTPSMSPESAVQSALSDRGFRATQMAIAINRKDNGRFVEFGNMGISQENITAQLIWVPNDENTQYRLAWQVYIIPKTTTDYWMVKVSAVDNSILGMDNYTVYDNWGIPEVNSSVRYPAFDMGILGENTTNKNLFDFKMAADDPSVVNTATYRVVPMPAESPNHPGGAPALRTDPWLAATANAQTLKWHTGASATDYSYSRGNNVWAYEDRTAPTNTGTEAKSAASQTAFPNLTFDFVPDFTQQPTVNTVAVPNQRWNITNLFYWNNLIHDIFYAYGFTEPAGNFQDDNLGRGGLGSDWVRAEAQDAAGTNNANFSTPVDGQLPRMQMFLWDPAGSVITMMVNAPPVIAGSYTAVEGAFSTANLLANVGPVTAQVVYYNDVAASTHEACVAPSNGAVLAGKIALIDRGNCNFTVKVLNAQAAGAVAVIMVNNVPGAPIIMGGGPDNTIVTPAVMISDVDGALIAAQLANNVNVTLSGTAAGTVQLDGDVDNGIIIHEYGHGISIRSTGGPAVVNCLNNQEQGGEGWSDYFGLMLTQDWAAATLNTGFNSPRGIGTYAAGQGINGPGIRPARYCTDFAVNNFTYTNLPGQAVPHGVGFVWCTMLWEMTWELINSIGTITPSIYNTAGTGGNIVALKLVMEGLRLQVCSPGFVNARDAILAADNALFGGTNTCAIWRAFARRGVGFSALQGSSASINDQTPAFDLPPACIITGPTVTINQAVGQPDPTSVSPISFTVVFSEPVIGFATGDVTLGGTAGATTGTVTGGPTTFNVDVTGMTTSGTVIASIAAGVCTNAALDPNNASTSTDNTVTYNITTTVCTTFAGTVGPANNPVGLRAFRDGVIKTCAAPGTCTVSALTGALHYVQHTWTNPVNAVQCVTVTYTNTATNFSFVTAHNGSVNTANYCTNWLGDPGSSALAGQTITWSFNAPPLATIIFHVGNVVAGETASYSLEIDAPVCNATTPIITPSTTTLTAESCVPPNNAIDPGETVTVNFCVLNIGGINTTNLVGTLLNTGGVTGASAPQNYGVVIGGGAAVCRPFTFTANGVCGNTITASIQLQDGAVNLGTITYTLQLGALNMVTILSQNFDGVAVPTLPAGWTAVSNGGAGSTPWATINTASTSAPNSVFTNDPPAISDEWLHSPTIAVPAAGATLTFRNRYMLENTFDGMVLEISINGGAFADIITAGGTFTLGGYNGTISTAFGNPIGGRAAWTGTSAGYPAFITTTVTLPAAASGQNVVLRWRRATDSSVSSTGAGIDDVAVTASTYVCCSGPCVTPVATPVANQVVCRSLQTSPVNFTSTPAGATFTWTNNNIAIGLAAAGTGNIPAFTAQNPTAAPITATITATPQSGTCVGLPISFTITVNPNQDLIIVADPGTTLCEGDPTLLTVYNSAGATTASVSHSTSSTITAGNSVSCGNAVTTAINSFWRVYDLATFPAITGAFTINTVTFGVEASTGGPQNVTVRLYNQTGAAFPGGTRTQIASQVFSVPNLALANYTATLTTPVTVSNTSVVVVEVETAGAAGTRFFIGSNAALETGLSYLSATACAITVPTPTAGIGFPNMHIILNLGGTLPGAGAVATGTFLWSPASGLSSTTSNPVAASPMNTTTYTVVRTTGAGCVASAQITITVNKRPVVTTHPVSVTNCSGTTATFTVAGTGTNLTYQWQVSTAGCAGPWVNLNNGVPYSGVDSPTLVINPVTQLMSGNAYRVILSGVCPAIGTANISNCAVLTVNPLPVVAITPVGPVCGGVAGLFGTELSVGSAPPPVPGAVTISSGVINLPVPDNTVNGVSNNLTVAGVPANATITNVSVTLNMPHTYPADMVFNLRGPSGQILSLYKHNTNTDNGPAVIPTAGFYNAVVNATSTIPFVAVPTPFRYGQTPPAGPYRPDALNGVTNPGYPVVMDPTGFVSNAGFFTDLYTTAASTNGVWTLAMCDGGPGDVGTLISWDITIDYTTPGTGGGPVLTYVWSPLAGLYTDTAATIPYTGSNTPVVYAAPTALTIYTVTATDVATNCFSTSSVVVNYTPPPPTVTPNPVTMCSGDSAVMLKSSSAVTTTATFSSGTISVPIPEGTFPNGPYPAGTSTIAVSGIPAASTISRVAVRMNITHAYVGDVVAVIQAPNGQILNLDALLTMTNNSGANFVNTVISSTGVTPLSAGTGPFTGTFAADAAGATFVIFGFTIPGGPIGYIPTTQTWGDLTPTTTSANGNWTLALYDPGAPDQGVLTNWSLDIDYVVGVPSTAAVWSPAAGLFSDASASTPYVAGTAVDSVWAKPATIGANNYQVTVQSLPAFLPAPVAFTNPAPITIINTGSTPYPSNLDVTGLLAGSTVHSVTLTGLSHTWSDDIDILLQSPTGTNVILMSDVGGSSAPNNVTYTFADGSPAMGTGANPTGTYRPTNLVGTLGIEPDNWPAPGPGQVPQPLPALSMFTGDMNGTWKLFVVDDFAGDNGSISGGYTIRFTVPVPPCTSPPRTVVVTVNAPATVTTQPTVQTTCTDGVTTFTVVAGGTGPFSYQWQTRTATDTTWDVVINGGVYSGATTATLTITAPPVSLNGNFYRVLVTGAAPCASLLSDSAMLTVNPLPTIVITADRTSLLPGLTATLTSSVTPTAASYTWLRDGVVLTSTSQGVLSGIGTGTLTVDVDGFGTYQLRVNDVNTCTNTSNSIVIKDSAGGKCFIYPNPSSGKFEVRYYSVANNTNLPRSLTVYDAKGNRVLTQMYSIGRPYDRMEVDMRKYGKGLYWVEIGDRNGNRITMCRVVIQ